MAATLAAAASRAWRIGSRSGNATPSPRASPCGCRARTRSRISFTIAPISDSVATVPTPTRRDLRHDAASRGKLANQRCAHRVARFHHIAQKAIYRVLVEDAEVAIRQHVHLERFQLDRQIAGHVAQCEL